MTPSFFKKSEAVKDNNQFGMNSRFYYSPTLKKWGYTGFGLSFCHSVIIQMKLE